MAKEIRWKQRFENYKKAFKSLKEALHKEEFSELEKSGVIQRFEFTYEMAWQTLQDLLELKGYNVKGPKPVIQKTFEDGYIKDWRVWHDLHEDRQKTVRTYDEATSEAIFQAILNYYYPRFKDLYHIFIEEMKAEE